MHLYIFLYLIGLILWLVVLGDSARADGNDDLIVMALFWPVTVSVVTGFIIACSLILGPLSLGRWLGGFLK